MPRLNNDRGAVAVIVAILMVPLLGLAAISIDIAATHAEKQQLQNGADAGALAIAQDCAGGSCGDVEDTAQDFAAANSNTGLAEARVNPAPVPSSGQVTVVNAAKRHHWFAPVLGVDSTDVRASATAGWGGITGGTSAFPLAYNLCEFNALTGGGVPSGTKKRILYSSKTAATDCPKPESGNFIPGGFGWTRPENGHCGTKSHIGQWIRSDPGNNVPNVCRAADIQNRTIILPVFDKYRGNGQNGEYKVHAYAAFHVTGYRFSGSDWNTSCTGSERCLEGYFLQYHDRDPNFEYGADAPNLGVSAVYLLPD